MNKETKNKIEGIIKKQRKMGKLLLYEIKKDPPKKNMKSLGSLSDSITLRYMNLLKETKQPKAEGKVQIQALEYAKSIIEGQTMMIELVKDKDEKERKKLLEEWKSIEKEVNQNKKKREKEQNEQKHWSDILKTK